MTFIGLQIHLTIHFSLAIQCIKKNWMITLERIPSTRASKNTSQDIYIFLLLCLTDLTIMNRTVNISKHFQFCGRQWVRIPVWTSLGWKCIHLMSSKQNEMRILDSNSSHISCIPCSSENFQCYYINVHFISIVPSINI